MLGNWEATSAMQRKEMLLQYYEALKAQWRLEGLKLSFDMPSGYEDANATYDSSIRTLYLNLHSLQDNTLNAPFYLLHEMRHAMQYSRPELFSDSIQASLPYVILYNGICYRRVDHTWRKCDLSDQSKDFENAYLSLPHELDANTFAL